MKLKYLVIDASKIPVNWDLEKWMVYIEAMKLPIADFTGLKTIEVDVSIWKWLKFKLGIKKYVR